MAKPRAQRDELFEDRAKRRRGPSPSPLTVAVLAALIEKPSHGYEITARINKRMRADENLRSVYAILDRLESEHLLWAEEKSVRSGWKRVFYPTELGKQRHAAWAREPLGLPKGLADADAWLVFSLPEEAEEMLAKLEEYEKDCMERMEGAADSSGAAVQRASWRSRMLILSWGADRERLEGEIRWIKRARREIEEYLAESR